MRPNSNHTHSMDDNSIKKLDLLIKGEKIKNMILDNKDTIFVITESKTKDCSLESLNFFFKQFFFIAMNNFGEDKGKSGVITLIPRKIFEKPTTEFIESGMLTKSYVKMKDKEFYLTLLSYYNPDPKIYSTLIDKTLTLTLSTVNCIIAGDFNQIIDFERDYESTNTNGIQSSSKTAKRKRAEVFRRKLENFDLNYLRDSPSFTFEGPKSKSTIDWILFSKRILELDPLVENFSLPFNADHKGQRFFFKVDSQIQVPKSKKNFRIPDNFFNIPHFNKKVERIIRTHIMSHATPFSILEAISKDVSREGFLLNERMKKKNDEERRKTDSILQKEIILPFDKLKYLERLDKNIDKEIRLKSTISRIKFKSENGASKFLSSIINLKQRKNTTSKPSFLYDNDGTKQFHLNAANLAKNTMEKLYSNERIDVNKLNELNFDKKLSFDSKMYLEKDFTIEEITNATINTPNRAAGPSGLTATFFKRYSPVMAPLLCEIGNLILGGADVNEFLLNGNIVLIPKKKDSNKVEDLRPITLLEIARKIITKAMTERIKTVLKTDYIVDKSQYFHPGRKIHDNVFLLELIFRESKRTNTNLHAVFLDYSKAFDRVNHHYLTEVLRRKNFGERAISFINAFLGGNRRVDFNGYLSDDFPISRGVPQGETLSPFLFVIALDPFISKIQNDTSIKGVELSWNIEVKLAGFADDLLLLSRTKENIEKCLAISKIYEEASNAKLNNDKSELISTMELLPEIKGIKQHSGEVRHLGFYFKKEGIINNLSEVLTKAAHTLLLLKKLYPNFSKKINLLKSYLYSSITYQAPILSLTPQQQNHFNKIAKWFLYEKKVDGEKIKAFNPNKPKYFTNVSLTRLCFPREMGGFNLHLIENVFSAFKSKYIMECLKVENNSNPLYFLLKRELNESFKQQSNNQISFFPFVNHSSMDKKHRLKNNSKEWSWIADSKVVYQLIEKTPTCSPPNNKFNVLNYVTGKQHFKRTIFDLGNTYNPEPNTIPVTFKSGGITKLKEPEIWWENVSVDFGNKKLLSNKIKLNFVLTEVATKIIPKGGVWTNNQKNIKRNIPIERILKTKIVSIGEIDDFKTKFSLHYWSFPRNALCICGTSFTTLHFIRDCTVYNGWIHFLFEGVNFARLSQFDTSSNFFLHSWILNWCAWKTYHSARSSIAKGTPFDPEQSKKHFLRNVRLYELNHLIFLIINNKLNSKRGKFLRQLDKFVFFRFDNECNIVELENNLLT
eukprot:TRINITY_DN2048_c0_g1_i3.p1 TRINITY_DN2048_c0_g1~~TRINITY_DN2048_c0_g1_i3.p1  ORF type:complete len:1238 (+),score=221.66 TRINITY_DN2048_c0_g1_i3:3263-6976(+)